MARNLHIAYHWLAANYHQLRVHFMIAKIKRRGKRMGLAPLDGYSDEAIAIGLTMVARAQRGDLWPDGTYRYDGADWQPTGRGEMA